MTPDQIAAWLQARTTREDITGCLTWDRSVNSAGHPVATIDSRQHLVRRWLFDQANPQRKLGERRLVPKCGNLRCVEPGHWLVMTPAQIGVLMKRRGAYNTVAKKMASLMNGRRRLVYTEEQRATCKQLREQGMKLTEIEEATGISARQVSRICLQPVRQLLPGAWVFGPCSAPMIHGASSTLTQLNASLVL